MFERFTDRARPVVALAQREANAIEQRLRPSPPA